MPHHSSEEPVYVPKIVLSDYHYIYEYSGISIIEQGKLDIYSHRVLLINTLVNICSRSDEGKKLLEEYVRLHSDNNTEFDVEGLKALTNVRSL